MFNNYTNSFIFIINFYTIFQDEHLAEGTHQLYWNERDHSGDQVRPGIYFVILKTGNIYKTAKVSLTR
ncbi:MAG: hypothetical protein APR63_01325 [Desulfuromonas sp. SDB]|nr:MAG: hypothetical protein APR63_01325 [Desulfuromonas sp. SDB]